MANETADAPVQPVQERMKTMSPALKKKKLRASKNAKLMPNEDIEETEGILLS